jgi:hypothetical protein
LTAFNKEKLAGAEYNKLVTNISVIPHKEILKTEVDSQELIDVVMEQLTKKPVLLHCSELLLQMIAVRDIKFYYMDPTANSIDEHLLANFDQEKAEVNNGFRYKLIIATDAFAMRGFDYRAKDLGITLVLAKSFAFER